MVAFYDWLTANHKNFALNENWSYKFIIHAVIPKLFKSKGVLWYTLKMKLQREEKSTLTLLAFQNTSAETLVKDMNFPTVLLPSDKIKDSEIAIAEILKSQIIISFGQKPQIKNKICLELVARTNDAILPTNFPIESFETKLEENNITYCESQNPGTSYCNLVYWNALKFINDNNCDCKFLFIHIPFEKNIKNIVELREKLNNVLKTL